MANHYQDQLLGDYNFNEGKDGIIPRDIFGVTIDIYQEQMVGGVDYAITAMGADHQGGMSNPGLVIFDESWNIVRIQHDDSLLGSALGPDAFIASFRPPSLGVGEPGTFYIGVFDEAGLGGDYHLGFSESGLPRSFGGSLASQMTYLQ
jgi:hypothetical protein